MLARLSIQISSVISTSLRTPCIWSIRLNVLLLIFLILFVMKNQPIDRNKVNQQSASAADLPKSGFDLSYNSYQDFILGRLHVSGYQHTMPADKMSFNNLGDFTFNRLVTPMLSDIEVSQHNFFVNLRSIDRTFEDAFAPAEHNSMNINWRTPQFNLRGLIQLILSDLGVSSFSSSFCIPQGTGNITAAHLSAFKSWTYAAVPAPSNMGTLWQRFNQLYMADYYEDYYEHIKTIIDALTTSNTYDECLYAFMQAFFMPVVGENSLLDCLGYNYIKRNDIFRLINYGIPSKWLDFINLFDSANQCEYALRAYYAVWYEYYRDTNLEPVSSTFPTWKDFGSTSIFTGTLSFFYLFTRVRSWQGDIFISSSPDDIMRHVYAPILNTDQQTDVTYQAPGPGVRNYLNGTFDAPNLEDASIHNLTTYELHYRDPVSGQLKQVICPVPSLVRDTIATTDGTVSANYPAYLDLFNLRQSQMLERYLKRNFYFGDEYRDRMLAHYGSVISDYSVRRPVLLSSSLSTVNPQQEISPVTAGNSSAGDRTVTAIASTKGDGAEFFGEEFGIVLNLISFMPRAQYAGICPQNLLSKQSDYPIPEFAAHNEELGRVCEIACSGIDGIYQWMTFGHYPYAHAYRSRVDEVHGSFLSDKQAFTFRRFFGLGSSVDAPVLNYSFIHCHPQLDMFADTMLFTGQIYGRVSHNFFVERCLPTPVEVI